MADILRIGLSALLTQQRALAVTSNNIANASTPGYSRQRLELGERAAERLGSGFVGTGVDALFVRRLSDDVLAQQLRSASSSFQRSDVFATLAGTIDNLLADSGTGLNITLQNFVNAAQDAADDPASSQARQVLLSEAGNLISRFQTFDRRLDEVSGEVSTRLNAAATQINVLGRNIAEVNRQIITAGVPATGQAPSDLLDQRDRLVDRLSELVKVDTVSQSDGTLNVFIGSGQSLVLGTTAAQLVPTPGEFNPTQTDIVLRGPGGDVNITPFLSGGEVGGLLDFRRAMLDAAKSSLGRMAVGIAETFNQIHREGMDLNGLLGGDFFTVGGSVVHPSRNNSGAATVTVSIDDVSALEPTSYRMSFDGAAFQLFRLDDGSPVAMSGSGTAADPFLANGIALVVSGGAAAGDQFQVEPLAEAAGTLSALIVDPDSIALAVPIRTRAQLPNQGNATISSGEVADATDPNLLTTTTIAFLDPNTYSINGAGAFAYTSGSDIVVNGARVQISGVPVAGDEFVIEANAGGVGDNRNGLRLAGVLALGVLDGGATSLQASMGQLVAQVGAQTAETLNQRDAQSLLLGQAEQALDSVRGVNLDEEAANLLRQEQLYQAAAQTIRVADTLFQSLLAALS